MSGSIVDLLAQKDIRGFMQPHFSVSNLGRGFPKKFICSIQVCSKTLPHIPDTNESVESA